MLILSQFAGAAEEMGEALIINPHDPLDIAETIKTALEMPQSERIDRHRALYGHLHKHDVAHWSAAFLKRLQPRDDIGPNMVARFPGLQASPHPQ